MDGQANLERCWKVREFENIFKKLFILFTGGKDAVSHEIV